MSWEHQMSSARANMYSGVSNTPPIPPRESSIPIKALKTPPPEAKKKKVKKTESSRIKEVSSKLEKESPLISGYTKDKAMSKLSGSRECLTTTTLSSQEMTLIDFVKAYSCQFPQRIKIINGYCGNSNRLTISANDVYNIHLLKHVRVAKVTDMIGNEYSVPVNTAIEFGLVFDPVGENRGSQQAVSGFNLRVSDILSLSTLPKALCCVSGWTSADGNTSLIENEIVAVKGVQKTRLKNKKYLKVYSLQTRKEVMVSDQCMALFSTRPRLLRMTLKDLMENIPDPFPNAATVHFADELYHNPTTAALIQDMSDRFLSDIVRIHRVETESSLIASAVYPEGLPVDEYSGDQVDEYVDIPLEGELLNIEVAPVETDESKIYDDTLTIYEKFDPAKLKSMKEMSSYQASAAQSLFYVAVKEGMEKHGVELDEPTAAYVSMTTKQPIQNEPIEDSRQRSEVASGGAQESDDDTDGYETIYHEIEGRGSFPVIGGSGSGEGKHMSGSGSGVIQSPGGNSKQLPSFLLKKSRGNAQAAPPPPPPPPHPPPVDLIEQLPPSSPKSSRTNNSQKRHEQPANTYQASHSMVFSPTQQEALSAHRENREERLKHRLPLPERRTPSPSRELEKQPKLGTMPRLHRRSTEPRSSEEEETKLKALEARLDKLEGMIDLLERASSKEQEEMKEQIKRLNKKIETLQHLPNPGTSKGQQVNQIEEQTDEGREKNRQTLSKLSLEQILSILDNMELSKYKKVFQVEQISGDIVMELTDDLLRDELEVHSKLHRIRLMKLVNGSYCPYQYMS